MNLADLKRLPADVPCGTCRACCIADRVPLREAEVERFAHRRDAQGYALAIKDNGECIYLTERGCSVHDAPPDICRRFDCRVLFLDTPKARRRERVEQNPSMRAVYDAGRRRLKTLTRLT